VGGGGGDIGAAGQSAGAGDATSSYRGAQGLDPAFIKELEKQFGFDKPAHERFFKMVWDYARFDFGRSFFRDARVVDLILEKMPVSISLGLWMTLIAYAISIPLGIRKAVKDGSAFDVWTSGVIVVAYAIPGFLFAVLLVVLFAGGSFWQIFPLRGLTSSNFDQLSLGGKILDYLWHITLPLTAMILSQFATLTLLTKNSFLDEIRKQYVPGAFIHAFFTGSLLIETIFSLDGLGLLSYEATLGRDYPVVFATLYIFALMGLVITLLTDLTYTYIDPRIDFEARDV
jgi:microcin C transport system permease protein